jgi:hypothetical protein
MAKKHEPVSQTLRAPRFFIRKDTSNWQVAKHYRWYGTSHITIVNDHAPRQVTQPCLQITTLVFNTRSLLSNALVHRLRRLAVPQHKRWQHQHQWEHRMQEGKEHHHLHQHQLKGLQQQRLEKQQQQQQQLVMRAQDDAWR